MCNAHSAVYKARVRGKSDTFYKELHSIADAAEPRVRRAYMDAIKKLRSDISMSELTRAVENEDIYAIETAINIDGVNAVLDPVLSELFNVYMRGAEAAKKSIPTKFVTKAEPKTSLSTAFDVTNPKSIEALRRDRLELISGVSRNTREGIRTIVIDGFQSGNPPAEQARRISEGIGLLPGQEAALANYEQLLIDEGLKPAIIKARVAAYADRLLLQRARTIARTETIRAANKGQYAMWQQALDDGLLEPDVKVQWVVTPDDALCPICESIADEGPVEFGSEFGTTVKGGKYSKPKSYNGLTPPIHPNCRCALSLTF